ncbi:MAG: HAD family hydrolase [Phycisphaerae bacterium]|jgi:predicted hydrolase (HD superfamily)|nr:HAD family hydrolase [Phycisphaerae bacterium]MDG1899254.1 HD domain-containing protein [Phycisphaerales bacterium]|tara:strand:- start:2168 stop:2758 length:591 start_codon:yes stop_codon:yes gene_type:complete
MNDPITIEDARALMHEWVDSDALRIHMEAVACCMGAYAETVEPGQQDRWRIAGLLHDFDYQKHPTTEEHPFVGVTFLRERGGVDEEILEAILGHAEYSGTPRTTQMAHHLFAVDELAGFLVACCKVRPNGIADLAPKSVKKKLKIENFAAGCDRRDIREGMEALGLDPTEHIQRCIDALRRDGDRLGLNPSTNTPH